MSTPRRIGQLLAKLNRKVVFAESCTGGLVSATLTRVPGISEHHCGGMVVYRSQTKHEYLHVPATVLADPGPVSSLVTEMLASGILAKTPEADVAVAVTGHLGPQAPEGMDGLVFVAIAIRRPAGMQVHELHCRLEDSRARRQRWVVKHALRLLADTLTEIRRQQA
jgi:PncC family amidohydrolase